MLTQHVLGGSFLYKFLERGLLNEKSTLIDFPNIIACKSSASSTQSVLEGQVKIGEINEPPYYDIL
jgi:hypothetical protein